MIDPQKNIQGIDAFCDWIPGISTITNGAELLYKLATEKKMHKIANKVDALASSIQPKKKATDLNIHLANKSKLDCFIGMIPIFGNIRNLYHYFRYGLPNPIEHAIENNNHEAVLLYFKKYPLSTVNEALIPTILEKAATHCDLELFKQVLDVGKEEKTGKWTLLAVETALNTITAPEGPRPTDSEEKINSLLDYCEKFLLSKGLNSSEAEKAKNILQKAALYCSNSDLFKKILDKRQWKFEDIAGALRGSIKQAENAANIDVLLTYCENHFKEIDFGQLKGAILENLPLPSKSTGLTQERMEKIVDLCSSCTLADFSVYCRDFTQKVQDVAMPKTESLYQKHYSLTKKLLDKTHQDAENPKNPKLWTSTLIGTFMILIRVGDQEICSAVYGKYRDRLSAQDKKDLLTPTHLLNTDDSKETMKALLLRCMRDTGLTNNDLTKDDLLDILDQLAEREESVSIAQDLITTVQDLIKRFPESDVPWNKSKADAIGEKCQKTPSKT